MIAGRWQHTLNLVERFATPEAAIMHDVHGALSYEVAVNALLRERGLRTKPPFITLAERATLKAAYLLGDSPETLVDRLATRGTLRPQHALDFQCAVNRLLMGRPHPADQMGLLSQEELILLTWCHLAAWTPEEFAAAMLADDAAEVAA